MRTQLNKGKYSPLASRLFALIFALIAILGMMSIFSPEPIEVPDTEQEVFKPRTTYSGYLLRVVTVTVIMVVFIIAGLWLYKKQLTHKGKNNLNVNLLGKHYLNDKQYLLKVLIEDRYILLGVSESSINYLTELDNMEDEQEPKPGSFGTILDLDTNEETQV